MTETEGLWSGNRAVSPTYRAMTERACGVGIGLSCGMGIELFQAVTDNQEGLTFTHI
jgi:hypothetical protein